MIPLRAVWHCRSCGSYWEKKPEPYQPGDTLEAVLAAREAEGRGSAP
jgi:hypothetical protein